MGGKTVSRLRKPITPPLGRSETDVTALGVASARDGLRHRVWDARFVVARSIFYTFLGALWALATARRIENREEASLGL